MSDATLMAGLSLAVVAAYAAVLGWLALRAFRTSVES